MPKRHRSLLALGLSTLGIVALSLNLVFDLAPWLWISAGVIALWVMSAILFWMAANQPPTLEQRLEALSVTLDAVPAPRFLTDGHGAVVYANVWGREWLADAMPLDRLSSHAAREYDGLDAAARLRQALEAGLADQVEIPLRGEMPEPDWFQVGIRPLDHMAGLSVWSLEDITARKAINDILSQERQDLADFLDFMPTGIYSVDVDGRFHYANQRFAQWLGMTPDDVLNLTLDDVIDGPARPDPDSEWQGKIRFRNTAGESVDALVFQGSYDDAGMTRTRSIAIHDVSADLDSDTGGSSRFRALFDSAPVAIAIADPDGAVSDCNQAFARLVQRNREDLMGVGLTDFLTEDDRRALRNELYRVLNGNADSAQVDARLAGTTSAQVSIFLGPLSGPLAAAAGEIEGAVVHVIDTTEQKNLEVQFAQAQKMQAMGQLAGGVAHDFNNLLTAMIGFCDLLLQRHAAGDPSFADIMQIKQNSNRAANLVRQLLAFSRKQPLQPQELNSTDHLTELSHLLTRLIGESIEYKLIHGRDLGVVRVDPGQFDQIIINLAVNARDAMPGGGTLTITTGTKLFESPTQLDANQVPAGSYVTISVADTGKGIAREDIGRIFEPFFSTKKETPGAGTGLGLATVYGIVRQTGGFILVESAPGQGATFMIYLPRLSPEGVAEESADSDQPDDVSMRAEEAEDPVALAGKIGEALAKTRGDGDLSGSGTVLLVEDEDAVRVFASRALKNKGYSVLEARTGEQAMDIMRDTEHLDLLITDMMMPGMDGGTLARFVRVERPNVRIILISGYSEEVARGDVVDSPDIHFLPKPFSLGQLATKVKDVLATPAA